MAGYMLGDEELFFRWEFFALLFRVITAHPLPSRTLLDERVARLEKLQSVKLALFNKDGVFGLRDKVLAHFRERIVHIVLK